MALSLTVDLKWEGKLANWALWKTGGPSTGTVSDAYSTGSSWEWWKHPPQNPQPLVGEALDTDRIVKQLDDDLQQALDAVYVWTVPETLDERAKCLGIRRRALYDRIIAAKEQLEELDGRRSRGVTRSLAYVTGN